MSAIKPLLVGLLLMAAATADAQRIRYFRKADLDRTQSYLMTYEISGADTMRTRCYRCTYDTKGRLTRWEYISALRPAIDPRFEMSRVEISYKGNDRIHKFYDERGAPVRAMGTGIYGAGQFGEIMRTMPSADSGLKILLNRDGVSMQTDRDGCKFYTWKLDSRGYRAKQYCYDRANKRAVDVDAFYEVDYINDSIGNLIRLDVFDVDHNRLSFTLIGYDSMRNRVFEKFFRADSTPNGARAFRYFSYDQYGHQVGAAYYRNDDSLSYSPLREFDTFGNQTIEQEYYANVLVKSMKKKFDTLNRLAQQDEYDPDGQFVARLTFTYDGASREIERRYSVPIDGELVYVASAISIYDSTGNQIRYEFRGRDGEYVDNAAGIALIVWERDHHGDILEIRYYDQDGEPVVLSDHGHSIVKYFYREGGEVETIQYLSADRRVLATE